MNSYIIYATKSWHIIGALRSGFRDNCARKSKTKRSGNFFLLSRRPFPICRKFLIITFSLRWSRKGRHKTKIHRQHTHNMPMESRQQWHQIARTNLQGWPDTICILSLLQTLQHTYFRDDFSVSWLLSFRSIITIVSQLFILILL
jgi:hypothetical protein